MPFDPFFSSDNKKHYVPVEGVDDLYAQIKDEPYETRVEFLHKKGKSLVESIVAKKLFKDFAFKRRARIKRTYDRMSEKAQKELKQGRRILKPVIFGGYGPDSGNASKQKRASRY